LWVYSKFARACEKIERKRRLSPYVDKRTLLIIVWNRYGDNKCLLKKKIPMKNTQRAILYASLFLLTTVTFGNISAMKKKQEKTEKKKREQSSDLKDSIEKNAKNAKNGRRDPQASIEEIESEIEKEQSKRTCCLGMVFCGLFTTLVTRLVSLSLSLPQPLNQVSRLVFYGGAAVNVMGIFGTRNCDNSIEYLEKIKKLEGDRIEYLEEIEKLKKKLTKKKED